MRVSVVSEYRLSRAADGLIYSRNRTRGYGFWRRYLTQFDDVHVVARVLDEPDATGELVEGPGIAVTAVPAYRGPVQFVRQAARIRRVVGGDVSGDCAVILRVPGVLGSVAFRELASSCKPYGLELVGDPFEAFAPGAVDHPLRRVIRWGLTRATRAQARSACGVAYVTERALQPRYPCPGLQAAISSIELPESALAPESRSCEAPPAVVSIVTVASLEQPYKGVDVLIDSVALLRKNGIDARLTVVGEGRCRAALEKQAARLHLQQHVRFTGQLPAGAAVVAELDRAELFVLASRTEGLPRALIEAMARALPCIGTRAGGIPELLDDADLVPPGDAAALAARIAELSSGADRLTQASARNLEAARRYRSDVLMARRSQFYEHVRSVTEAWQRTRRPSFT